MFPFTGKATFFQKRLQTKTIIITAEISFSNHIHTIEASVRMALHGFLIKNNAI